MDDALEFLENFLKVECDFFIALYSKPFEEYKQARRTMLDLCDEFWDPMTDRFEDDEKIFERYAELVPRLVPRPLFKASSYEHPKHGLLLRAIVSTLDSSLNGHYSDAFFVATIEEELRVVSNYTLDWNWKYDPKAGPLDGWSHVTGWQLDTLGKLVEARKLTTPTDARYLPHWQEADE